MITILLQIDFALQFGALAAVQHPIWSPNGVMHTPQLIVGISVPNYYFAIPHNVIIESSSIDTLSVDDTRYNPFGLKAK